MTFQEFSRQFSLNVWAIPLLVQHVGVFSYYGLLVDIMGVVLGVACIE